jgi:photosystem II stability/assembly factor-like uncharacterized protein
VVRQTVQHIAMSSLLIAMWAYLFFSLPFALAQEKLTRPTANLHGVCFLSPEEGWVVGQLGKIFHTTDGGKNWEEQPSRTNLLLTEVDFVDQLQGWAVGEHGIILHSEDGGKTWKTQQSGVPYPLFDVDFIDKNKGWAVGHWGTILFTDDGGQHWSERSLSQELKERNQIDPAALNDIVEPATGEVVAKAGQLLTKAVIAEILKREIRNVRVREDTVLNSVFFLDDAHGWIVGEQGHILRTDDGGQHWETILLPRPPQRAEATKDDEFMGDEELAAFGVLAPLPSLYSVYFVSPQHGWAVGQEGTIVQTNDGGRHWEFQQSNANEALYDVGVMGKSGWVAGDKGAVLVSNDGGAQWEKKELGLEYHLSWLRRLAVTTGERSFLIGADGLVLASGNSPSEGFWLWPSYFALPPTDAK